MTCRSNSCSEVKSYAYFEPPGNAATIIYELPRRDREGLTIAPPSLVLPRSLQAEKPGLIFCPNRPTVCVSPFHPEANDPADYNRRSALLVVTYDKVLPVTPHSSRIMMGAGTSPQEKRERNRSQLPFLHAPHFFSPPRSAQKGERGGAVSSRLM